jgi:hypothetical protein
MANFNFKSPSVKFQEIDRSFASTPSLGITSVGMVGETLKGPAFSPILATDKSEFRRYFGGTSTEKFPDGSGKMKYLGPIYANAFLEEGNQLYFTRVLGKSGYDAGRGWAITVGGGCLTSTSALTNTITGANVVFSSSTFSGITITGSGQVTDNISTLNFEKIANVFTLTNTRISSVTYNSGTTTGVTNYSSFTYTAQTDLTYDNMVVALLRSRGAGLQSDATFNITSVTGTFTNTLGSPLSNFTLTGVGLTTSENFDFNLDVTSSNYIAKAMGFKNSDTKSNMWVEAVYPDLIRKLTVEGSIYDIKGLIELNTQIFKNYKATYTNPETPWIVSELNGSSVSRLFKFISYSDGDSANKEIKIAIENINPTTKEFDVVVRDYNDSDSNPSILERFGRCVLDPLSNNFIMRKIGGVYSDAETNFLEDARSSYIYVNVNVAAPINSIPCGFEGYLFRNYSAANTGSSSAKTPSMTYKKTYASTDKVLKTYLGISEKAFDTSNTKGLSINDDLFRYLGALDSASSYTKTKGFHLDSGATSTYTDSAGNVIGEFEVGAGAISNSASVATGVYQDANKRKFVLVPYGGFDGWDVNYENFRGRMLTSSFAQGGADGAIFNGSDLKSDYNAYLEAYQIYEDTERTPINLFTTPGINWSNNTNLVEDVLEIIEEIRQDALYIIDAPDANLNDTPTVVAGSYADDLDNAGLDSSYAATYVPWIKRKDADSNTNIYIPPTGEVLKAMALADRTSFIWFATAGLNRGGLPNARDVRKTFKESDRDTLYLGRLNPIVKFSNNTPGIFIYGQKTLQVADSKLDRIDVRRLLLYAKQIISSQARLYLFEPNDETLASSFISESNKKLKVIQDNRGLQTFRVRLDNSLNTAESRDRNEIYFVIELLPIGAVEFIGLTFVVNKSTSAIQFNA